MPEGFFQVQLKVVNKSAGSADLIAPSVLRGVDVQYAIVKDGGNEAIVKVHAVADVMDKIEKDSGCKRLTEKQMADLRASYPAPKLKKKYRPQMMTTDQVGAGAATSFHEVDAKGERIVDTFQTVRSGFYLIDVPIRAG